MADPLVTGVRTARTVEKSDTERTYEDRLARSTSGGRFERTQSVQARAFGRVRTKDNESKAFESAGMQGGNVLRNGKQGLTQKVLRGAGEKANQLITAQEKLKRLREFGSMVSAIVWVDVFVITFSVVGLLLLFFSDTTAGAVASFVISAITFGSADLNLAGMLFIGLSFCVAVVSYVGMIIYMIEVHRINILNLTGFYYIAALILPVASMVPGINIVPWFTLWTFLLLMAPKS